MSKFLDEVRKLIEQNNLYLAYLKDEGFRVATLRSPILAGPDELCFIKIQKDNLHRFDWDDVKDYLIPYLELLDKDYELGISFTSQGNTRTLKELKDRFEEFPHKNFFIDIIKIYIKKKPEPKLNKLQKFGNYFKNKFNNDKI